MKRKVLCESNHHIDDPEAESPVLQQQCEAGAWQWQRSPYMCPQSLSSPLSTVQCPVCPLPSLALPMETAVARVAAGRAAWRHD